MRLAKALVALALAASTAACASGPPLPSTRAPDHPLPVYAGDYPDLYDDGIDPHAFGVELETPIDYRRDLRFQERVKASDAIVRARISTVTNDVGASRITYQIALSEIEHLGGTVPADQWPKEITVRVDANSPAFGIVKSFEERLIGKSLVVFVKNFTRSVAGDSLEGDELHFHGAPDDANTLGALKDVLLVQQFRGK
jgi:hypothetical protein